MTNLVPNTDMNSLPSENLDSYNEVYHRYAGIMFQYALIYTKSKQDAEDVMQEVFMKVWRQWNWISMAENVKGYLFMMTRNESNNYVRKRNRQRRIINLNGEEVDRPYYQDRLLEKECNLIYEAAKKTLSEKQLRVTLLRELDYSRQEIADELNISKNTTDNHLSNALKKLRGYVCRKLQIRVKEEEQRPERRTRPAIAA